jgi:outer membrane protein assembly factor BamD
MIRRFCIPAVLITSALTISGCRHNHATNPIANLDSKQPDKVLFDRAIEALKKGKYDTTRITLQTLINTYPDSEYIARAKLAIGDSWYEEGSAASLQQAEAEYKDFETFFPNLPEAAEAQMKVANIHYRQMEKPDRDFTHAKRAEDEYRQMIQQYPDSKLLPEARQHLREVQEVLAEREFRIGRFYYLRESWPAAIARLKSLTDKYPLYSQADDALMMLGDAYERDAQMVKNTRIPEAAKARLMQEYLDGATAAYSRVVSRYPAMDRSGDARSRLKAMNRPVPTPTQEAIAQNKAELEGREELGRFGHMMLNFHKRPDTAMAAKSGDPTLVDPQSTDAPAIVQNVIKTTMNPGLGDQKGGVSVEGVKAGKPGENQPVPRSENETSAGATLEGGNLPQNSSNPPADAASGAAQAVPGNNAGSNNAGSGPNDTGIEELKVNTPAQNQTPTQPAANQPASSTNSPVTQPAPAMPQTGAPTPSQVPAQVNDAQTGSSNDASANTNTNSSSQDSSKDSSSKKKKKKKFLF